MAKQKSLPIYRLSKMTTNFMLKSQNEDVSYNQMASNIMQHLDWQKIYFRWYLKLQYALHSVAINKMW